MSIRRIGRRVGQQDWFAVAIDLGILIVGVFLGLQANNWNEERILRARASSYHARLIEDLRAPEWLAHVSIAYYTDVRTHALAALHGFSRPERELDAAFVNDLYQATQIFPRAGKHTTYDEILSSGNAELIGTPALRERLANFYWRMDGLLSLTSVPQTFRTRIRSLIPYETQMRIRDRCDEQLSDNGAGLVIARLTARCDLDLAPGELARAITAVRSAPGLEQDLTGELADLDLKPQNFSKVVSASHEMRIALERSR